jgi:outer membrane lipoprotein-sorting protein
MKKTGLILAVSALLLAVPVHAQDAAAAARGKEVMAAAAAASGGDALDKVKEIEMSGSGDINSPMGAISVLMKVQIALPDKSRMELELPMGIIVQGFDGKAGWLNGPQGVMEMPADLSPHALRGIALSGGVGLFQQVRAGKVEAEFKAEEEFNGRKAHVVEWKAAAGPVQLYLDAETKLLIGAKYRSLTMQGAINEERRWSDFKAIDGVQFPSRWQTYRDGTLYSDLVVKDVKFNAEMADTLFARPQ